MTHVGTRTEAEALEGGPFEVSRALVDYESDGEVVAYVYLLRGLHAHFLGEEGSGQYPKGQ